MAIFFLIKIIIFIKVFSYNNYLEKIKSTDSRITLKIKGKGNTNLLNSEFTPHPNKIIVNGHETNTNDNKYDLNEENNIVILIWDKAIEICCQRMFKDCEKIEEIDLSEFDSSSITKTTEMFKGCKSLITVNFKNFDASKVQDFSCMFMDCESLIFLNLSNFVVNGIKSLSYMFSGCKSLEYINLQNMNPSSSTTLVNIFKDVPKNIVYCFSYTKLTNQLASANCKVFDCSNNWRLNQSRIIEPNQNQCVDKCGGDKASDYEYEYDNKCYKNCPNNLNYYIEKDVKKCKCKLEKCKECSDLSKSKDLCISCNEGYYSKYNDNSNIGPFINCYNNLKEYYLDKNNSCYKPCYHTCKECDKSGNDSFHNCKECKSNFKFTVKIDEYYNCYENCNYYYYLDNITKKYVCTNEYRCPEGFKKLIVDKNECTDDCSKDNVYKYESDNKCIRNCPGNFEPINGFCKLECNKDSPFELVNEQKCIKNCGIIELF